MYTKALSVLALVGAAQAHMSLYYPPPMGGAPSINPQSTALDPEFNYPLGCCGPDGGDSRPSPGVCRGHLDKFDTEEPVVTWQPGQDATFQLTDFDYDPNAPGGTHSGGSCQVGFSLDKGKTWKVAASYHGACPHATPDGSPEAQTFDFKVPTGMPEGEAIFGWVWLNREHESFMSCAKVMIGNDGGDSTPTQPKQPSESAAQPEQPAYSETAPEQPEQPEYDQPEEEESYEQPDYDQPEEEESYEQPEYEENYAQPPAPTAVGGGPQGPNVVTAITTVATTVYQYEPEATQPATEESEQSNWSEHKWWNRPHRQVKPNARRYQVDGSSCECHRDELTLAARCSCDAIGVKRSDVERKALRLHRRTFYKRVDACDWNSAPAMEVSYFTSDANCAPNAKANMPESDAFELSWDVNCGVVDGVSEYEIRPMTCDMYGGGY
jgi:hypothetical protein